MATAAALVFGLVSYAKLPLSLFPELTYPTLTVRTEYPGAAPEEVEEAVVRPLEELVATVDGLVRMRSVARSEGCDVVLEFGWGWSMVAAAQEVRERLDLLRLPDEVSRPLLLRYDPTLDPVLRLGLHAEAGALDLGELRDYSERTLRRQLERIEGVAAVSVVGGLEREVSVALDGAKLAALGLSPGIVAARLQAENVNVAGGDLTEGSARFLVRTLHQLRSLDAIRQLVVVHRDGAAVRLGDIAEVALAARRPTHRARFDGHEGVELAVYKEADVNLVAVARRVKARLQLDRETGRRWRADGRPIELTPGVHAKLLTDQSRFIEAALAEVRNAVLLGGLLAMAVLYLFLRQLRSTLIAALAIPISIGVAFAPLYLAGVSLNLMSLGGLALGVGMLVDNAVVVLESIARCREQGDGLGAAAERGVREVGGAVTAATLTTAAVFAPMIFVEGVAGQVFGDLALTVVVAVVASLAVALSLIPMLASRGDAEHPAPPLTLGAAVGAWWTTTRAHFGSEAMGLTRYLLLPYRLARGTLLAVIGLVGLALLAVGRGLTRGVAAVLGLGRRVERATGGGFATIDGAYQRLEAGLLSLLGAAFRRPLWVLLPTAALVAIAALILPRLGSSLVPDVHRGRFDLEVSLPAGTPLDETARLLLPIEQRLAALPEVEQVSFFAGVSAEVWRQSAEGEHTARLRVRLRPGPGVAAREQLVLQQARAEILNLPGAQGRVTRPALFSFAAPLEINIIGIELEALRTAAAAVTERLRGLRQLDDVRSTALRGFPEIRVRLREERLARLGLAADEVARALRDQIYGRTASAYRPHAGGGERFDIVVRGDLGPLPAAEDLGQLVVGHAGGVAIPLAAVAELTPGVGPVDVRHEDGARAVVIEAGLAAGNDLEAAAAAIRQAVAELRLPVGVEVRVAGQDVERQRAMASLRFALLLAAFLVYAVLAAQFESFSYPLLIMVTVPLGLVGAILGLAAIGMPLSVVSLIGAITLIGIVVNNAIVLLDRVRRERAAGAAIEAALLTAVRLRLRPILMTTLSTVFGLLPLALGTGEGAEIRTPIAVTLIFGLSMSTLMTLIVLPVAYRLAARETVQPAEEIG